MHAHSPLTRPAAKRRALASHALAVAAALAASAVVVASVCAGGGSADPAAGATSETSAGMRVYVDPSTGALTPEPSTQELGQRSASSAVSTSMQGLVEEPAPGGGVMIDLQGRFQSEMRATITPENELRTECVDVPVPDAAAR